MTYNSRLGTAPEEGIKAPCVTATTVDVTLAGLGIYTVDDRILVAAQTDPAENGIYLVQESAWLRSSDMNQSDDMISGMLVADITGSIYSMQFTGSWNPGETDMTVVNLPTSVVAVTALISSVTYTESEIDTLLSGKSNNGHGHNGGEVSNTPSGNISATDVQAAIDELDNEKQPSDVGLTSIAAAVTAANKMLYTTAADTYAVTDLTAFARTLLDDSSASTARSTLACAPLASPAFTGSPTAPTQSPGDNSTKVATTAYVEAAAGGGSIGVGQTMTDVGGSRGFDTTYTNSTGSPIEVIVTINHNGGATIPFLYNGVQFTENQNGANVRVPVTFIVQDGDTYRVNSGTGATIVDWWELR